MKQLTEVKCNSRGNDKSIQDANSTDLLSKKGGKDQELVQLSTTPDPGGSNEQTRKHDKHKT